MIRAAVLSVLALVAVGSISSARAQTDAEGRILTVVNAAFDAEAATDFNRLVSLVHPRSQHLFRDLLSARTDVLLRSYPQEQISAVSGLPAHPKDLSLSDPEFFVFTCYMTKLRHPDFAMDWTHRPFTLEATTFDTNQLAHVVLSWPDSIRTERTDFNFARSLHLFLHQERSQWLIWSCPFAQKIGDLWCYDLAKGSRSQPTIR